MVEAMGQAGKHMLPGLPPLFAWPQGFDWRALPLPAMRDVTRRAFGLPPLLLSLPG